MGCASRSSTTGCGSWPGETRSAQPPRGYRLALRGDRGDDNTLGEVWYSGMVGATPKRDPKHLPTLSDPKSGV